VFSLLIVGVGGFVGAVARYSISGAVHRFFPGAFPLGTLVVNAVGCLCIGMLMSCVDTAPGFSRTTQLFVVAGVLGALTTFSSFGYETVELLRDGNLRLAMLNVAGNMALGLGAVWIGFRALPHHGA